MEDRLPRKLAAILHADVVGYSRLVGENEDRTHRALRTRLDLIATIVEDHAGRVVNYAGDAVLADFGTAVDALDCAAAIQRTLEERNADVPDDQKVQFRIGVNVGDVIVDRDDIYGDGVNVAARLESLAEPGGICISDAVRRAVGTKLSLQYEDMGKQHIKNIEEPVQAYRVLATDDKGAPKSTVAEADWELPDKPSIAVLPFTNMSGDPEQEYFSDGITEDIITALSRISGLLVVARNSTMVYKGKAVDIRQVGREQGVQYVLEGSVRKAGNRIRVTAQLIDAATGHHRWAERYDRSLDDIFAVQDDITHQITVEMRVHISIGEKARMLAGRTESVAAWERVLRADELGNRFIREDNLEARRLVEEALDIDPRYASAWTELGWTHWEDSYFAWTESRDRSEQCGMEAARKALEAEEDYPNALSLLGYLRLLRGEYDEAVELTGKAVTLAPGNAENVANHAYALICVGNADQALETIKRAFRLSPICPAWYRMTLGLCHYARDEQDSAIRTFQEAIAAEPGSAWSRIYLTGALVEAGAMEDARDVAREVLRIEPSFSVARWGGLQFKNEQVRERIIDNLVKAGLPG